MKKPQIHPDTFIAPGAAVYGDVTIGKECSIWFHAKLLPLQICRIFLPLLYIMKGIFSVGGSLR